MINSFSNTPLNDPSLISSQSKAAGTNVDPSKRSENSGDTRQFAMVQTLAARRTLYEPYPELHQELSQAANKLYELYESLDDKDRTMLGKRLFGVEGLMPQSTPSDLLQVLNRVDQNPGKASGRDRAIVIALMGDIGALYADTGDTTGTNRAKPDAARLRNNLSQAIKNAGLSAPTPESIQEVKNVGGSSAVGPDKKAERSRSTDELCDRTGIHNLGKEADNILGVAFEDRIPTTKWAVAHIAENRVNETIEPLAGHMSGSPAEILQIWDMLRGEPLDQQFVGRLHHDNKQHLYGAEHEKLNARAAGTAAFLVGLGYHSSVEVIEGIMVYTTGQSMKHVRLEDGLKDAAHLFGAGAATDLINEILQPQAYRL